MRFWTLWLACLFPSIFAVADVAGPPRRVVFLGDSNTFAGGFVAWFEAYTDTDPRWQSTEVINLGLPSETASGLSEPSHPFPRPDVNERVNRVLEKLRPDMVVVGYGVNDAIYAPLDADRFAMFQTGLRRLIDAVLATGARCVVLTPPPLDTTTLAGGGTMRPAGLPLAEYSWEHIYDGYTDVMLHYADWVKHEFGSPVQVVDLHWALVQRLNSQQTAGIQTGIAADGVHWGEVGHRIIGEMLWRSVSGVEALPDVAPETVRDVLRRQHTARDRALIQTGHRRPGVPGTLPVSETVSSSD